MRFRVASGLEYVFLIVKLDFHACVGRAGDGADDRDDAVLAGRDGVIWEIQIEARKRTEAYTKGRDLWRSRNAEKLHDATLLLEQSVEKDPDFALAHAALADAYAFDYANWKKAEAEAGVAIRLDPASGEPHASLGFVKMFWQWDLVAAETELKQAVAKSPDYATGHQWYAANMAAMGRFDAALAEIRKAVELDRTSAAIRADFCQMLYFNGRNQEALAECSETLKLDPDNLTANQHLYEIYCTLEMNDEAVNKFIDHGGWLAPEIRPGVENKLRGALSQTVSTVLDVPRSTSTCKINLNIFRPQRFTPDSANRKRHLRFSQWPPQEKNGTLSSSPTRCSGICVKTRACLKLPAICTDKRLDRRKSCKHFKNLHQSLPRPILRRRHRLLFSKSGPCV